MGQCEASPTDLFTECAAWEDREDEHVEHSDDGEVDCWGCGQRTWSSATSNPSRPDALWVADFSWRADLGRI